MEQRSEESRLIEMIRACAYEFDNHATSLGILTDDGTYFTMMASRLLGMAQQMNNDLRAIRCPRNGR